MLDSSHRFETRADRRRRHRIAALVDDGDAKTFLLELTDQVLRIRSPERAARRFRTLVETHPAPAFASRADRLALAAGSRLAAIAPRIVMPLVVARLRREFSGIVLPAEER